jgi:exonuclease SbcD
MNHRKTLLKILHTSDIHLNAENSERQDALKCIIDTAKNGEVDALLISGDLFDSDNDAFKLKPEMRGIFSGLPFDIFIIPGNHDSQAYEDRAFFGSNVRVIRSHNDIYEIGNVVITGMPYKNMREQGLYTILQAISAKLSPERTNLLLFHGELLDSYYSRSDFGEEGEARYMPVRLDFFQDFNFDYILAGHFHTNFNAYEFDKGDNTGYFVYTGSPVSITKRETGKRKANLFEAGGPPKEIILDTEYYEQVTVTLDPLIEADPVSIIREKLGLTDGKAKILLKIKGYFNSAKHDVDETGFNEFLVSLKEENPRLVEFEFKARDLKTILEDYVYKSFISKIDEKGFDDSLKNKVKEYFLKAMTESMA